MWGSIKWNRLNRRCSTPSTFTATTADNLDFFVNEAREGRPENTYFSTLEDKLIYDEGCGELQVRPFSGCDKD